MKDPADQRPSLWKLGTALHEGVRAGDARAAAVADRGKRIIKVIFWLFVLNLVGSCASLILRPEKELTSVEATIKREGDKAVATAAMPLDPAMSPVRLSYALTIAGEEEYDYAMTVTDPQGGEIKASRGTVWASSGNSIEPLVTFDVRQAGPHQVRFEIQGDPVRLRGFRLHGRTNMTDSYFLGITLLLGIGAWGAQRWWRRSMAEPWWHAQHPAAPTMASPPIAAPPVAVARASEPVAPFPAGTGSVFSEPFAQGTTTPPSGLFRLGGRLSLWVVSVGISVVWLPAAAFYLALVLFGVAMLYTMVAPSGSGEVIKNLIETPIGQAVLRYLFGEERSMRLQGDAAMVFMGTLAFKLLLPFHVILVVVRAICRGDKDEPPPAFAPRFKQLVRWNAILYVVMVVLVLIVPGMKHRFFDTLVGLALYLGFTFGWATGALAITTVLDKFIAAANKGLE